MNLRSFNRIAAIAYLMLLVSCGSGGGGAINWPADNSTGSDMPLHIHASLISFLSGSYSGFDPNASVIIQDPSTGTAITSAVVTINDNVLTYNPAAGREAYEGNIAVASGEAVVLGISVGGKTYTASAVQFTSSPTVSIPVAGTWHASIPNIVTWSGGAPTANAVYNLGIVDAEGGLVWPRDTNNYFKDLPISNTFYSIPPNQVTPGDRMLIAGIVSGVPIPGASSDSQLVFAACSVVPVTVVDSVLTSIAVTPAHSSLPRGTKQQFTATGFFSDNSTQDVTLQSNWTSVGGVGMDYSIPGLGRAGGSTGEATVIASFSGFEGSASVTVLPPSLLSIQLVPADSRTIVPGTVQHFTAYGQYSDGAGADLTSSAAWSSSDPNVATVASGQATAASIGTTTISVTSGGITKSSTLTVADLPSIAGNYVYLQSDTGDYVGAGKTYTFTQANAQFIADTTSGFWETGGFLEFSFGSDTSWWSTYFATPSTMSRFQTGYFGNLTRYPFSDPALGGLDVNGDSRGCNQLTGWFAIDSVTYTNDSLTAIDLRFEQHCEGRSPALYGWIHWVQQ